MMTHQQCNSRGTANDGIKSRIYTCTELSIKSGNEQNYGKFLKHQFTFGNEIGSFKTLTSKEKTELGNIPTNFVYEFKHSLPQME